MPWCCIGRLSLEYRYNLWTKTSPKDSIYIYPVVQFFINTNDILKDPLTPPTTSFHGWLKCVISCVHPYSSSKNLIFWRHVELDSVHFTTLMIYMHKFLAYVCKYKKNSRNIFYQPYLLYIFMTCMMKPYNAGVYSIYLTINDSDVRNTYFVAKINFVDCGKRWR